MASSANTNVPALRNLALRNLVNGEFVVSNSSCFFSHVSARSQSAAVDVPESDLMDVVQVVQAMNRAQTSQSKASRDERDLQIRNFLTGLAVGIEDARTVLSQTLAVDIGMPISRASARSVTAAASTVLQTLETFENSRVAGRNRYVGSGNAVLFTGWTDPLLSFCRRVPVVLAADNGICVKPSSRAPRTIAVLAAIALEAMKKAGLPAGLFAVLHGHGARREANTETVGEALLAHPGFKTIFWIGRSESAETARESALAYGKRFHFVGSGRNPALLFQGFTADIEDRYITELAHAITDPHGLGPYRPSRLFVHESIYKDVIARLGSQLSAFIVGDPLESQTEIGPLPQKETSNFEKQVALALSETGRLVLGGELENGIPRPTLIRDLTNCSTLQSEELAGPWATIASFKYAHDALKYANTSPLGLASYVMHPDPEKAHGIAEKLEASRVFYGARPPWPRAVTADARPVKRSANATDGLDEIFSFSQWHSTHFREAPL